MIQEGANIIQSHRLRQLLNSLASALNINLIYQSCSGDIFSAVCHCCKECDTCCEGSEDCVNAANNPDRASDANNNKNKKARSMLINNAVLKAMRHKHCRAQSDMPFYECFQIVNHLLNCIINTSRNSEKDFDQDEINELMSIHQRINQMIMPSMNNQKRVFEKAIGIMLDLSLIIFNAGGCWLEYLSGDKPVTLEKGNCHAQREVWSRSSSNIVIAPIESAYVRGIICVETPADTMQTEQHLSLLVKQCIAVFELKSFMDMMETGRSFILGSIKSAVIFVNRAKKICYANRAALRMLRPSGPRYQDISISDIPAPWNDCILNDSRYPERGRKSKFFGMLLDWAVYPLSGGDTCGWLVVANDLTDFYMLQEYGVESELIMNNSVMLSTLAHEVKNPLSSLRGLIQLIRADKSSDESDKYLERCIRELDRASSLMDDFLQMKKLSGFSGELIDLGDYIDDLMPIINGILVEKSIKIIIQKNNVPPVNTDPEQLTQVMINLVKNAADAIDKEGSLYICIRQANPEWVELLIRDSGKGISPEVKKRLFESFVTTKESGTGLGLAISKAIIHNNRGEISAINHPDGGALFAILLPSGAYDYKPSSDELDILLVTCDDPARFEAEQVLLSEGYKVFAVSTYENAFFTLNKYRFTVAIFDGASLEVPEYYAFREAYPDVITIVLYSDVTDKKYANAFYLPKQEISSQLNESVRRLIESYI